MNNALIKRNVKRKRRAMRVRKQVRGVANRPRLTVFKSNCHITAQLIDDAAGMTMASASTLGKAFQGSVLGMKTKVAARHIGKMIAESAQKQSIQRVIFDRGRYKFHGIVAEVAAGAREAGLQF